MDIEVASHLQKKLVDSRARRKHFGDLEKSVSLALSSLEMASCMEDLTNGPPLYRHKLRGNLDGLWALRLSGNWRMILQPLVGEVPSEIVKVRIINIDDYH